MHAARLRPGAAAGRAAPVRDQAAQTGHNKVADKGDIGGRRVLRVGQVEQRAAEARRQTAAPAAQQRAAQQADAVAQLDHGRAARGRDFDFEEKGRDEYKGRHQADRDNII